MTLRFVVFFCLFSHISSLFGVQPGGLEDRPSTGAPQAIDSADIYVGVALLQGEIDLIRRRLDKPTNQQPPLQIQNAAPRELFYQAITLFRKVDRLCFELIRQSDTAPTTPTETIRLVHVDELISQIAARLGRLKEYLDIESVVPEPPRDAQATPSDVYRALVQTNRQMNLLLQTPFSLSDTYQQITLAVGYTARLRSAFPGRRIPPTPAYEPNRTPADVYQQLECCYTRLRDLAGTDNLEILSFQGVSGKSVLPCDGYDLACLLVSELAFLHRQWHGVQPPRPVVYPGTKTPSLVYQRAVLLHTQLTELQFWVNQTPTWLAPQQES